MEDISITELFLILAAVLSAIILFYADQKIFYHHVALFQKKIQNILSTHDLPIFFSSYWAKYTILKRLSGSKKRRLSALYYAAVKDPIRTTKLVSYNLKKSPQNKPLLLLSAELDLLADKYQRADHTLDLIKNPSWLIPSLKAKYLLLKAKCELYQTDMQSAAAHTARALKFYQKQTTKFFIKKTNLYKFEQAESMQTLAQIYRISGLSDAAFNLFLDAQKIYQTINLPAKIIETNAYLGLLEITQKDFDLAHQYLQSAHHDSLQFQFTKTTANINNWLGQLYYLKEDIDNAQNHFLSVLETSQNANTLAFAAEMLARIYLKRKDDADALKYSEQALDYHTTAENTAGMFESLYLRAQIYYNRQAYNKSRQILTELIKNYRTSSAIYYPANAYTLLGLIEFKQNNLNRAQTLFKQALDLEHGQNRLKGAIADYNNLAEIAFRQGIKTEAENYLNQALQYATEIEDDELIAYIKSKLQ